MVKLDIFSDPICPWCYIGKSYLDRALEKAGNHPFNIQWHPFQLNPEMPLQGVDRREYLERKFGNKDLVIKAYAPVLEHAALAGLNLKLEKIMKSSSINELQSITRAMDRILMAGRYVIPIYHNGPSRIAHKSDIRYPNKTPLYGDRIGFFPDVWWKDN